MIKDALTQEAKLSTMQGVRRSTVYTVQDLCRHRGTGCPPSMTSKCLTTSSQVAPAPSMAWLEQVSDLSLILD